MKLNLLWVLALLIFATACETEIEGKIIDNFDKAVSNVKIKIDNSAYESLSNEDGSFNIPFSPGKIGIVFEKENYLFLHKTLEVIDAKDYPMGTIKMTRMPDSKGIFIKGCDDYVRAKKIELNEIKGGEKQTSFFSSKREVNYRLKKNESIPEVKVPEGAVEIYDNILNKLFLFQAKDEEVARTLLSRMGSSYYKDNFIKMTKKGIDKETIKRTFNVKDKGVYVLIVMKGNEFTTFFSKEAYAFNVVN